QGQGGGDVRLYAAPLERRAPRARSRGGGGEHRADRAGAAAHHHQAVAGLHASVAGRAGDHLAVPAVDLHPEEGALGPPFSSATLTPAAWLRSPATTSCTSNPKSRST